MEPNAPCIHALRPQALTELSARTQARVTEDRLILPFVPKSHHPAADNGSRVLAFSPRGICCGASTDLGDRRTPSIPHPGRLAHYMFRCSAAATSTLASESSGDAMLIPRAPRGGFVL